MSSAGSYPRPFRKNISDARAPPPPCHLPSILHLHRTTPPAFPTPCSTAPLACTMASACPDRLHRASRSPRPPPPSRRATTIEALASRRGEVFRVTLSRVASCLHRCHICELYAPPLTSALVLSFATMSLHSSKRMLQLYVSSVLS
jgi:hypothetical protein